jgi:protein TonB
MSNLRLPFAAVAGVLFSSVVFLALYQFISVPLNIGPPIKATAVEFTRKLVQSPIETRRPDKPHRDPPTLPPSPPRPGPGGGDVPDPGTPYRPPVINVGGPKHAGPSVGVDRDVIPVVRFPPEYPARAIPRGIEGWVQIQFTVTTAGTVRDPVVVAAEPHGIFEEAALNAIARWRYNPRIDGGVAVERVGLQTVIRFELNK